MKILLALTIATLAALSAVGGAASAEDEKICRRVVAAWDPEGQIVCDTPQQWAELDRRIARVNDEVTCRRAPSGKQVCASAEQWRIADRRAGNMAEAQNMGERARVNAAALSDARAQAAAYSAAMAQAQSNLVLTPPMPQ